MAEAMEQLEALYREHGDSLLRYLCRMGGGHCAQDLLQETFARALKRPEAVARALSPRAWLYGIARNVALTALRTRSRLVELDFEPVAELPPEPDPRLGPVREAIQDLPDEHREALRLRIDNELSYDEIADVLGIPVGTVRSRLHYAVRKLRRTVEENVP